MGGGGGGAKKKKKKSFEKDLLTARFQSFFFRAFFSSVDKTKK